MKFGGTSVGTPQRMGQVAELAGNGDKNIVVLSAMSGDTNTLIKVAECFDESRLPEAFAIITDLYKKYTETIRTLIADEMTATMALSEIDNHLAELPDLNKEEIVAKGEIISTTIMYYYLMSQGASVTMLPALLFMRTKEDGSPDYDFIGSKLSALLQRTKAQIIITQGFICRDSNGEISNLKRGGSDYSATIIGSVLHAEEIQIWTDIDGLHNNDPRYVEDTVPVRHLSHSQAAALAYFGAKILHPLCIEPAQKAEVAVKLLNTFASSAPGTIIDNVTADGDIIAVAARDGIALRIDSESTLTFADSDDTYIFASAESHPRELAAVCAVGDIDASRLSDKLMHAGITPIAADTIPVGAIAVVRAGEKVAALQALRS